MAHLAAGELNASQIADDIRGLFCDTCDRLGIAYRLNRWNEVSVARAESVTVLDSLVGRRRKARLRQVPSAGWRWRASCWRR